MEQLSLKMRNMGSKITGKIYWKDLRVVSYNDGKTSEFRIVHKIRSNRKNDTGNEFLIRNVYMWYPSSEVLRLEERYWTSFRVRELVESFDSVHHKFISNPYYNFHLRSYLNVTLEEYGIPYKKYYTVSDLIRIEDKLNYRMQNKQSSSCKNLGYSLVKKK